MGNKTGHILVGIGLFLLFITLTLPISLNLLLGRPEGYLEEKERDELGGCLSWFPCLGSIGFIAMGIVYFIRNKEDEAWENKEAKKKMERVRSEPKKYCPICASVVDVEGDHYRCPRCGEVEHYV